MSAEPRYFEAVIQDGKIYERKYGRETPQIGVAIEYYEQLEKEYNELIVSYNEYQQMLIEMGKIKVPLTPEQQVQKLLEINELQSAQISALMEKLNEHIQNTKSACENTVTKGSSADDGNDHEQYAEMG